MKGTYPKVATSMRIAWLGHRSDTAKVGGSNPPRPTKTLDAEVKVNENFSEHVT